MSSAEKRKDTLLRLFTLGHRTLARASGGRLGRTTASLPIVQLTTIGRSTGTPRPVMLATPLPDPDRVIVIASKGGDDRHPDWYLNLVANPEVIVEPVGGDGPRRMLARTATPAEKAELWPKIAANAGGYAGYQRKTERDIPVVICEPLEQAGHAGSRQR